MTSVFLILIVVVIFTCIWLNNLSARIGLPTLLAFMLLGIIFGNVGAIPMHLDDKLFAEQVCTVALIFIMFYGGFGTRWEAVKPVVRESVLLASAGVIVTATLTGVFCHYVLGWTWAEGLLLGSVVSSTDAASVFSILRSKRLGLRNNTAPMLEMESGSNDPCAYMLTAVMISIVNGTSSAGSTAWMVFAQIAFGAGLGFLIAKGASWALQRMHFSTSGFDTLFLFAVAIAAYAIPDVMGGNGYLSCYIVGVILGNDDFKGKKAMVGFFDGLTGLMQVLIFFLLGLLARPSQLHRAVLPALAISVFLLLVARPAAVFSILSPFRKYSFSQQSLISFVGLRGAASIVFAIMAIAGTRALETDLFNIVFCIVLISISLQGSLIPWVAKKLDMIDSNSNVLKTFNDYSEESELQFGEIYIGEESAWNGKAIKDLCLPGRMLLVMVLRDGEQLRPKGDTVIRSGDKVVTLSHSYLGREASLYEKVVKPSSKRVGRKISDYPGKGLLVMVIRNQKSIIPTGDTVLEAGDRLVILND